MPSPVTLNFTLPYTLYFNQYNFNFTLPYSVNLADFYFKSNLDNSRFRSNFPKWSSTYQNYFANTSKLIQPILESYSGVLGNISEKLAINVANPDFSFAQNYYYYVGPPNLAIPNNILTEQGLVTYIGESDITYPGDFVATKANLISVELPIFKETVNIPAVFSYPTYVFVRVLNASILNPAHLVIYGTNKEGIETSESITLPSEEFTITMNSYLSITRIICDVAVEIVNYIDCSSNISYATIYGPQKKVTRLNGNYFQPGFTLGGNSLYLNDSNSIAREEIFKFILNRQPDKIFISHLLDVFYLKSNVLYSSKLYLDYQNKEQYNSTYNNNDFIFINNETPDVGDNLNITLNYPLIKSIYGGRLFRLKVISNNVTSFIDLSGNLGTENTWLIPSNIGSKINVPYVATSDDTTFVLEFQTGNQSYCAGYYYNKLPEFILANNISDIFFKDSDLYITQAGNLFKLHPIRPYYTSSKFFNSVVLIFTENYSTLNFNG
jgi:hypothetical protein